MKPRPVDLNVLVTEAKRMLDRVIGEDIELVTRLSPDLGQVDRRSGPDPPGPDEPGGERKGCHARRRQADD